MQPAAGRTRTHVVQCSSLSSSPSTDCLVFSHSTSLSVGDPAFRCPRGATWGALRGSKMCTQRVIADIQQVTGPAFVSLTTIQHHSHVTAGPGPERVVAPRKLGQKVAITEAD